MADLFLIAEARGPKSANAVFFHGLGGNAKTTWQARLDDETSFWPAWLARDIEGLSVYSVGYEAPVSRWRGSAMHLTDRATNVLARLLDEPALVQGPLVLIGHSLGGLVIKELLRTVESDARRREDAADFLRRVEKIAFLATPHTGSDLATWGDRLRIIVWPTAATACLVRNDPNLRSLNHWYRGWANERQIAHLVLTETKALRGRGMIVEPDSGDPGLANADIVPIDADHLTVCKPSNNSDQIYTSVKRFIERRVAPPRDRIAELADVMDELPSEVAQQVAAAQNERYDRILAEIARDKGVEVAPLRAVLVKLGEKGVPEEDIPKRLDTAADELIKLRAENEQLRRGPPALAAIAEEVQALIDKGEFDDARRALARGREAAHALRIDASRYEAAFLAQEARVDDLQLAYRPAAAKYAEAASLIAPIDTGQQWRFLLDQAAALYKQGDEFGDNAALSEAIELYRLCLAQTPRERVPLDWAVTQMNLGNALATLGARESGTARLEEAVIAYREALQERTRARVPLDWAMTQMNLGNALGALGERESGTARLEEAVAAYREALQERTRARVPLDWAMTKVNLGTALWRLGERESGTARLEEAVAAYRDALQENTRARVPLEWARTQMNLGLALGTLGARESGTARLEEAVAAFREALQESTRERVPLAWAMTQNNLGNALRALGERESGTARLEEAVSAHRAALVERTRERGPLHWAATQNNLGIALRALGERERGTAKLEEAVAAHREALQEYTRARVPLDWARNQMILGTALLALGVREEGTARLEETVAAFREALQELTRERVPLEWAESTGNQGFALMLLAERRGDAEMAKVAVEQIDAAFTTSRDGGDAPSAAFFEAQLPKARALAEKLAKR